MKDVNIAYFNTQSSKENKKELSIMVAGDSTGIRISFLLNTIQRYYQLQCVVPHQRCLTDGITSDV